MTKNREFLVLKIPVDSDQIDAILADNGNGRIWRSDLQAAISRQLTGDDTEYEGLQVSRAPLKSRPGTQCFACRETYDEGGFWWCDSHRVYHCPDPDCERSCSAGFKAVEP